MENPSLKIYRTYTRTNEGSKMQAWIKILLARLIKQQSSCISQAHHKVKHDKMNKKIITDWGLAIAEKQTLFMQCALSSVCNYFLIHFSNAVQNLIQLCSHCVIQRLPASTTLFSGFFIFLFIYLLMQKVHKYKYQFNDILLFLARANNTRLQVSFVLLNLLFVLRTWN